MYSLISGRRFGAERVGHRALVTAGPGSGRVGPRRALALPGLAVAKGAGYFVAFVVRSCPSFSDIFANEARNDIQRSLVDLGRDSPYTDAAKLVNPQVQATQTACNPLPTGKARSARACQSRAVYCPPQSFTDPSAGPAVTPASTPLADKSHNQLAGVAPLPRCETPGLG